MNRDAPSVSLLLKDEPESDSEAEPPVVTAISMFWKANVSPVMEMKDGRLRHNVGKTKAKAEELFNALAADEKAEWQRKAAEENGSDAVEDSAAGQEAAKATEQERMRK